MPTKQLIYLTTEQAQREIKEGRLKVIIDCEIEKRRILIWGARARLHQAYKNFYYRALAEGATHYTEIGYHHDIPKDRTAGVRVVYYKNS